MNDSKGLTTENLKKYVRGAFEAELNVYAQECVLSRMRVTYSRLGTPAKIHRPQKERPQTDIVRFMMVAGMIIGPILGIVMGIVEYSGTAGGFWWFLGCILVAVIYAVIGFVGGGVVIGGIWGLVERSREEERIDKINAANIKKYETALENDRRRVKNENLQKENLSQEMRRMESMIADSKESLRRIYAYNILCPDYQNLCAVSSIYGYLQKGRTNSLTFNDQTGDQGAYNIYEYELRMNLIIVNTQEILRRLDEISANQYELSKGLRAANARVEMLCKNVSKHIKDTRETLGRVERCAEITAYQAEQINRQQEFMNWLCLLN